jgi:hypothetical protein
MRLGWAAFHCLPTTSAYRLSRPRSDVDLLRYLYRVIDADAEILNMLSILGGSQVDADGGGRRKRPIAVILGPVLSLV